MAAGYRKQGYWRCEQIVPNVNEAVWAQGAFLERPPGSSASKEEMIMMTQSRIETGPAPCMAMSEPPIQPPDPEPHTPPEEPPQPHEPPIQEPPMEEPPLQDPPPSQPPPEVPPEQTPPYQP
ncbi:hypothetical protein GCM10010082_10440 [Kushneria pakistanensis]|uniref:Uncharacterized protein n=2 Tax=Kushneria pakistanensis TaxID=1508770 RepID=A0ABQ3FEB6_9GAMM|nr:hypothetical protein GCM10010082_10440 [Kushneria pakistanensis]